MGLAGCATCERYQNVHIESEPSGADIFLDGERVGETPQTLPLATTHHRSVYLKKSEYRPELIVLELQPAPDRIHFYRPPDVHVELVPLADRHERDLEIEVELSEPSPIEAPEIPVKRR